MITTPSGLHSCATLNPVIGMLLRRPPVYLGNQGQIGKVDEPLQQVGDFRLYFQKERWFWGEEF